MPKITPFLWFDGQAEEAANFYASVFPNSKVLEVSRHGDSGPGPKGAAWVVRFQIEGQEVLALNGGPMFKHSEAFSFLVSCRTQDEIDRYTEKLSAGGPIQCGWMKDRFGLTWQVAPENIAQLIAPKDPAKAARAMKVLMGMGKIDIAALENA